MRHRARRHPLSAIRSWAPEILLTAALIALSWITFAIDAPAGAAVAIAACSAPFVLAHTHELGRRSTTGHRRW